MNTNSRKKLEGSTRKDRIDQLGGFGNKPTHVVPDKREKLLDQAQKKELEE